MLDFKRVGEKIKQLFCTSKIKTNVFSKTSSTGILKLKNKLHYFYVLFTPMMCVTQSIRIAFQVFFSVVQFVATILCMVSVRWTGKRPMALVSLLACAIATTTLGVYTFVADTSSEASWLPFLMFLVLQFFTGYGVAPVPWMLVSEVFPMR